MINRPTTQVRPRSKMSPPPVVSSDSGKLERAESEIRRLNDQIEAMFAGLDDLGLGALMTDGRSIRYANGAFCTQSGYDLENLMFLTDLEQLVPPAERRAVSEHMAARLRGEELSDHATLTLVHRRGKHRTVAAVVKTAHLDGTPTLLVITRTHMLD